jgi:hypothetical protein
MRVPITFAHPEISPRILEAWSGFTGLWKSADGGIDLTLVPRVPRPGRSEPNGVLSGFIPEGSLEGVLVFEIEPPIGSSIHGAFYGATTDLVRRAARITLDAARSSLMLTIDADAIHPAQSSELSRVGEPSFDDLAVIAIIGHRGLGFGGLDNRPVTIPHAWYFGASGLEVDVIVPCKDVGTIVDTRREPLIDAMTIYHPTGRAETEPLEDIDPRFHRLEPMLGAWRESGISFLYLDAKLGWLEEEARRTALDKLRACAVAALRGIVDRTPRPQITIAAVDSSSAAILGACAEEACLSWTLEWTELEMPKEPLLAARTPPCGFSFDLNRIRGSGKWPLLDLLMANLTVEEEREIGRFDQALIFWTANDPDHFAGALHAATHPGRMARRREPGEIAILTDYPHRLASWLASKKT